MLLLLAASACAKTEDEKPAAAAGSAAPSAATVQAAASSGQAAKKPSPRELLQRPRTQDELGTTNARIFLGNLSGSVTAAKAGWNKEKPTAIAALQYAVPLTTAAKISGDLRQFGEALRVVETALKKQPDHEKLLLHQAELLSSLHRFDKAAAVVEKLHARAPSEGSRVLLADVAWNRGDYDTAIKEIRAIAAEKPSLFSQVRLAQLELSLGNIEAAKGAFARAETLYQNVSPVPIAWLNVQRGLMGLHTGQFESAETFYREAIARMPDYPMAVEHLAEIESLLGKREEAVTRYKRVVEATDNPELIGALAGVLKEFGQEEESVRLVARAKKRFSELLKEYPEAMAGHAADFFLNEGGDKKQALALLERNFKLRPNAEARASLALAKLENDDLKGASKLVDDALATPVKKAEIYWTAARVRLAESRADDAKVLAERAKALNPKIEQLEGPLATPAEAK
jgi:tetratricopeptide (TPR) repeat protein